MHRYGSTFAHSRNWRSRRCQSGSIPAQHRDPQLARGLQDVFAKAQIVRQRPAFIEDAAIDAQAQMLVEIAENVRVHFADGPLQIDADAGLWLLGEQSEREGKW